MLRTKLVLLLFVCVGVSCAQPQTGWDVLLFVQHWLPTACQEYMQKNASNQCVKPPNPDSWTIHGIWPTKLGTKGPNKCNTTWTLQPDDVESVMDQLKVAWSDIFQDEGFNTTIWAHEWLTHGTCAADLPTFKPPVKYFQQGIDWYKQYNMTRILEKASIVPSDDKTYKLGDIQQAIKSSVGKEPHIDCFNNGGKQYLAELRVCFDKSLQLIDCDTTENAKVHLMPGQGLFKVKDLGSSCNSASETTYPFKF